MLQCVPLTAFDFSGLGDQTNHETVAKDTLSLCFPARGIRVPLRAWECTLQWPRRDRRLPSDQGFPRD